MLLLILAIGLVVIILIFSGSESSNDKPRGNENTSSSNSRVDDLKRHTSPQSPKISTQVKTNSPSTQKVDKRAQSNAEIAISEEVSSKTISHPGQISIFDTPSENSDIYLSITAEDDSDEDNDLEEVKSKHFEPIQGVSMSVRNTTNNYAWFAIYNYYPVKWFDASTLSSKDVAARQLVFDFKDGRNPELFARIFATALINQFGLSNLRGKTLLVIPASSKQKTDNRFKHFLQLLSQFTEMQNGYSLLSNNDNVRTPAHMGGPRNVELSEYLFLSPTLENRDVIVIDDVRTSGNSSNQVCRLLQDKKVSKMTFVYLAKTVSAF